MLSICIIYIRMDVVVHPSHSTEKRIVFAWIRTGDICVSNGGFDNCTLTHHATYIFVNSTRI